MLTFLTHNLVHLGYSLQLLAFVARDVLWLRALLALAQSVTATYAWMLGVTAIAGWNALFVVINLYWVVRIVSERRAVDIPEDLRQLYDANFSAFAPGEFLRWWRKGEAQHARGGARLTEHRQTPEALYFVLRGSVDLERGGEPLGRIAAPCFIGEMSLLTGQPATATACAHERVEMRVWSRASLAALAEANPRFWVRLQSVIGHDLVNKLQRHAPVPAAAPAPSGA